MYKYNIAIGIPTLNRADLLQESLLDLSANLSDIDNIYIVDNGNQTITVPENLKSKTEIYNPGKNIGVATSWNWMADKAFKGGADYILLLNDDVVFGKTKKDLEASIIRSNHAYTITSGSWASVLLSKEALQVFSKFDENFYPAYFEDNDFVRRLTRCNIGKESLFRGGKLHPKVFRVSMTIKKDKKVNNKFSDNKAYYVKKWGGVPTKEEFLFPFNERHAPRLTIATRTSGRPNFFKLAYESIHAQGIPRTDHLVICDDDETEKYVDTYSRIIKLRLNRDMYKNMDPPGGAFYNLYLNHSLKFLTPGDYVAFMDDDDFYIDNTSLKEIWDNRGDHDLIIWRTRAAGGTVPNETIFNNKQIIRGQIAMPGFMIRYDAIKKINFSSLGCGDFHFMEKIAKQSKNPLWVNKVIGSTSPVRRQGKGERKDAVSYEEAREASGIKYL